MVGTHLTKTRGGISTLISEILKSRLKDDFQITYVESQAEDHGKIRKAVLALTSVTRFLWHSMSGDPDVVYVHLGSNASLYRESIFIFLAKAIGKKVIANFHAGDIDLYFPRQPMIGQKYIRAAMEACDHMIAVSHGSAKQLAPLAAKTKIVVIPNAIDTSSFDRKFRDEEGAVRVLFVGAMGKLKGERDLVDALVIVREDGANIKASFLGYGCEALAAYAEDKGVSDLIEHIGPVAMSERVSFYQNADIFVLPTYAEAMPMSVIEAMAAGLAIVTTKVGGIPELISDGEDGVLVECGDVNALADRISVLINNRKLRKELGRRAREKARAQFDMGGYVERLRRYINEVVSVEDRS